MKSDYLDPKSYNKLFVFMTYENTLAVRVSLETGLRIGDVLKLKPDDLRGRTITYTAEKTGKKGRVVVSQDLANRLRTVAGDSYIFPKRGKPNEHRARQTVWKDVKKAASYLRDAGALRWENATPHSARKTFAVRDAENKGLKHTQRALQHRDISTTRQYAFSDRYVGAAGSDYLLNQILANMENIGRKIDKIDIFLDEVREKLYDDDNDINGSEVNTDPTVKVEPV